MVASETARPAVAPYPGLKFLSIKLGPETGRLFHVAAFDGLICLIMNMALIETIKQAHARRFGAPPAVVAYAPGRVEILGNHTDYNEGFVLSAAIDLGIAMAVSPAPGRTCALFAVDLNEEACLDLPVKQPAKKTLWANYVLGVVNKLSAVGEIDRGFQATLSGNIPMGGGLSSSAALEVAAALGLCA
ncbi:MAG: hypothetical protein HYV36_01845, partial [Lentisphaerae bacterium]|nr:hypothetical protein [Lentisphaerota bacterium]